MRKINPLRFALLAMLLVVSCVKPHDIAEESNRQNLQESAGAETYYWHDGEKVAVLLKDCRTKGVDGEDVYPSCVTLDGAEEVATSDVFYLKLKDPSGVEIMNEIAGSKGVLVMKEVPYMPLWYILSIKDSDFSSSLEASSYFYETGMFADVDPAFILHFATSSVNDPYYVDQWGLNNLQYPAYDINVEDAWAITRGAGVKVAVVDTGIDPIHGDLDDNLGLIHYNTETQTTVNTPPLDPHGTHVAGIIAAEGNNGALTVGVAYEAELISVYNSFDISEESDLINPPDSVELQRRIELLSCQLASGINWAWGVGADVINCSWGVTVDGFTSSILEDAIDNALTYGRNSKGCVVVFAAGNESRVEYPGNFDPRILVVGAIGSDGYLNSGSGYGPALDVVAPGESVISTVPGSYADYITGTSQAAPHVSGIAALVIAANPNLSREEVVRAIELSCRKIPQGNIYNYNSVEDRYNGLWHNQYGYGLPDAGAAVLYAWNSDRNLPSGGYRIVVNWEDGSFGGQSSSTVTLNGRSRDALVSLMPSIPASANYTYFWQVEDNGYSAWKPSFTTVYGAGAMLHIPANPNGNLSLRVSCGIYDGTTLIGSPVYTINVRP